MDATKIHWKTSACAAVLSGCLSLDALAAGSASDAELLLTVAGGGRLPGTNEFYDEDIARYTPETDSAEVIFKGKNIFSGNEAIEALHYLSNGNFLFVTQNERSVNGFAVSNDHIIEYNPESGDASLYFDGSSILSGIVDFNALYVYDDGRLLFSTTRSGSLGALRFTPGDLIEYAPATGAASILFKASERMDSNGADINGVHRLKNGNLLLTFKNDRNKFGALTANDGDIVEYNLETGEALLHFPDSKFARDEDIVALSAIEPNDNGGVDLNVSMIVSPQSGLSPLSVRFSPVIDNDNLVVNNYRWDFNGDGSYDLSDTFGRPQTYVFTGTPGQTFDAKLTVTFSNGEEISAIEQIQISNSPPTASVSASTTNGRIPLEVNFTLQAQDASGLKSISADLDGNGSIDEVFTVSGAATSQQTSFNTTYSSEGTYVARFIIEDTSGATAEVSNQAITVDANGANDPVINLQATATNGNVPLSTTLSATADLPGNGDTVQLWEWDLDGNGTFETTGGTELTDSQSTTYQQVETHYPTVRITTTKGYQATAAVSVKANSTAKPALNISGTNDTLEVDHAGQSQFTISLPYETHLKVWIEDRDRTSVRVLHDAISNSGSHDFIWDGMNNDLQKVGEGDYYVVLSYTASGQTRRIDLRDSTGGQLSYYGRKKANPRYYNRLESPLIIDYEVSNPAEVTFFWQISFGQRLMTLMEHERLGRGSYSLYWNGDYPSGEKVPSNLNLLPGILFYALADNVIFVKEATLLNDYQLEATVMADPRRTPVAFSVELAKAASLELVVSDMDKGVNVASRVYTGLEAGQHDLTWDGKNNDDQYLTPGDYRIGVRAMDDRGHRSLYWYRTQQIRY